MTRTTHECLTTAEHTTVTTALKLRLTQLTKQVTATTRAAPDGRAEALAGIHTALDMATAELGKVLAEMPCLHQAPPGERTVL